MKTISAAQFATGFDLRPNLVAWFLGAGASAASGIPTCYAMIRDFKARIFCREMNLSKRDIDTADPIWIDRIDAFFQQTSLLPPDGDPTEYAKAFEAVYPEARHRRQYIYNAISKGSPCFGHKLLGSLMAAGKVDCVFTTNFDPLIENSAHSANEILPVGDQNRPTVAAIDSADRAMRCLNESAWPLVAKLHGDYQSIAIKNTGSELEEQDARMRYVLVESGKRFGMIFVGYSGRDASIMEALNAVLDAPSPFPNGLYWLTSSASRLRPAVIEFLDRAEAAGVDVAVVECATFDELAADIIRITDLPKPLLDRVMEGRPTPRLVPVQLPTTEARNFPVLRYSSLLIESMPRTARRLKLAQSATSPLVREMLKEKGVGAAVAANGRELAVFGRDQGILDALAPLGATLNGEIKLDPVADSWAMGLIYDALVRSLTRRLPLIPRYKRTGHSVTIAPPRDGEDHEQTRRNAQVLSNLRNAYKSDLTGTVPGLGFPFQEGLFLNLDLIDGRWWLGFEPYTFVHIPRADAPLVGSSEHTENSSSDPMGAGPDRGGDPAGDWRRERWAQRYNRNWASIIAAWAQLLTDTGGTTKRTFGLQDAEGIDAVFEVSPVTGWSRPIHHHAYLDGALDWELAYHLAYPAEVPNLLRVDDSAMAPDLPQVPLFLPEPGFDSKLVRLELLEEDFHTDFVRQEVINEYERVALARGKIFSKGKNARLRQADAERFVFQGSSYHDYLGTNLALDAEYGPFGSLRSQISPHGALETLAESVLANATGINGLIFTSDRHMVLQRRSDKVIVRPSQICSGFSGTVDKKDIKNGSTLFDLKSAREMVEETGIRYNEIKTVKFLGITRELIRGGTPEMFYAVDLKVPLTGILNRRRDNEAEVLLSVDFGPCGQADGPKFSGMTLNELLEYLADTIPGKHSLPLITNLVLWHRLWTA